ncbi:hypothetical protein BDR03DRAFT_1018269 [Suillus americanus]|nr:hypothetical protein BDR03DRAFT_1018269 [Suillus americanus]
MIAPKALLHLAAFVLHRPQPLLLRLSTLTLDMPTSSSYDPYIQKTPPTLQAERKMAGMMGRLPSSIDSGHNDETARKIFSQGLQRMSTEAVRCAAYYKEAELEYHCHLSMTLAWEAEKFLRLQYFIDSEQQDQEEQTTQAFEEAALFTRMVIDHDPEHASQDRESITTIQERKVERVKQLNIELDDLNIFLPLDPSASDPDNADAHGDLSDHSSIGDCPEN